MQIGLVVGNWLKPGAGFNVDPATLDAKAVAAYAGKAQEQGIVDFLLHLIPSTVVDAFAQGFARLEVWNEFFRDQNLFARTWIAAHAGRTTVDGEAAKAPNFDSVAPRQGIGHGVQDGLDGKLGVALGELSKALGQASHEIGSSHEEGLKSEAVMNPPDVL